MDLQTIVNNSMEARRAKEMKTSEQLTISELTMKLEAVENKELPIVFDDGKYKPTGLGSWRGSYCELAINYEGGGQESYLNGDNCKKESYGDSKKYHDHECGCEISTTLPENPTTEQFLKILKDTTGRYFNGYKGDDFLMGKTTPIWVANYGDSSGFKENKDYWSQGVVGVTETDKEVVLETKCIDY